MPDREPAFEWSDAWILCALLTAVDHENPVSLAGLIAFADGINKAMVTRSELEEGIGRLVDAGFVRVAGAGFELTPKALALNSLTVGPFVEDISGAIGAREWEPDSELPSTTAEVYVTREAFQRAEKQYRRRDFWQKFNDKKRS
jgi:hypothetical protein